MSKNIYFSLDEARTEIKKRSKDDDLRKKVLEKLGGYFIPEFQNYPLSVSAKNIATADNGLLYFYFASRYIGAKPHIFEYGDDLFVSLNEEKKGLGRLKFTSQSGKTYATDIIDFRSNEKIRIKDCRLLNGSLLTDFHHSLISIENLKVNLLDKSMWFTSIGKASDWYYYFLLHYVVFGVLFETFYDEGGTKEDSFTHNVVYPTIERIREEIGLSPIIVRAYPEEQTAEEDFFWWDHSPIVNLYIENYAKENNFVIKEDFLK